jgi:hypothetical protein
MIIQMFGVATQTSGRLWVFISVQSFNSGVNKEQSKLNQHSLLSVLHVTASEAVSLLEFV